MADDGEGWFSGLKHSLSTASEWVSSETDSIKGVASNALGWVANETPGQAIKDAGHLAGETADLVLNLNSFGLHGLLSGKSYTAGADAAASDIAAGNVPDPQHVGAAMQGTPEAQAFSAGFKSWAWKIGLGVAGVLVAVAVIRKAVGV